MTGAWWPIPGVLCLWGGLAAGFTLTMLLALYLLYRRPPPALPATWPAIAVLRPCEGSDPLLFQNLLSSALARYEGARRVLLLVPDAADPAHAVACAAAQAAREVAGAPPVEVVVTGIDRLPGKRNRKVAQLGAGAALTSEEVIVQADSDVLLTDESLPALVAALLAGAGCGAAFAAPLEIAPVTLADRASAALLGASGQSFLGLFALSSLGGGTPSLAGALCAYQRAALRHIGGFAAVEGVLGEDYELARRLRGAGYGVALSRSPAGCTDSGRGLREVVARVARWMMVVRAQRPGLLLSYPALLAATPALAGLAVLARDPRAIGTALLLLLLRAGLAVSLRRLQGRSRGPLRDLAGALLDVLLAELLMWAALVRALRGRHIEWRGHRYRVGPGGRLMDG